MALGEFLANWAMDLDKGTVKVSGATIVITFANRTGQRFPVELTALTGFIRFLADNNAECHAAWKAEGSRKSSFTEYEEKSYRAVYALTKGHERLDVIDSLGRSQTLGLTLAISRLIAYFAGETCVSIYDNTRFDIVHARKAADNIPETVEALAQAVGATAPSPVTKPPSETAPEPTEHRVLPKPFLLLAGISGTGKTRFVRIQAALRGNLEDTYLLVPVRPDWHDPSDLLGYVSRIGGERFVCTPLLRFMVRAWRACIAEANVDGYVLKPLDDVRTFWLCLDEMNLAPVEQYFADFLSVVETRRWVDGRYTSEPLLRIPDLAPDVREGLRAALGSDCTPALWAYLSTHGLPLPPNLVVAGTVNMDETTHGFPRKVIDRALTLDFGAFFPNRFEAYFQPDTHPVELRFPRWSEVTSTSDLAAVVADPGGLRSLQFLDGVNQLLRGTPFELAFRALNELLVSLRCFAPADEPHLHAVWDDFLLWKVLPRIEGDAEKLRLVEDGGSTSSLLTTLLAHVELSFRPARATASGPARRPDLLRRTLGGEILEVEFRTTRALARMQQRLEQHRFTSFWP